MILKWVFPLGDLIELVCNSIGAKTGPILNRADANGGIGSASIEEAPTRDRSDRTRVCPLLEHSGHCWILVRDGSSAFDPKRTSANS